MVIAAFIVLGVVSLAALALAFYTVRNSQIANVGFVMAAFDRLSAKSLAEVTQNEHLKASNAVAIKNLQDALSRKVSPAAQSQKRKLKDVEGNFYTEDELETM